MKEDKLDLTVIGHLNWTTIKTPRLTEETPGGCSLYTSLSASKIGAKCGIVSRIGEKFIKKFTPLLSKVDQEGVIVGKKQTRLINTYNDEWTRTVTPLERANTIRNNHIPENYKSSKLFYICPILNEVHPEILYQLKKEGKKTFLDPQGYIRRRGMGKNSKTLNEKNFTDLFRFADILKISREDLDFLLGYTSLEDLMITLRQLGPQIIIITLAEKGSKILFNNKIHHIPAFKPAKIVDVTGAGDVYGGVFANEFLKTNNPLKSAYYASCAASFVIEGVGTKDIPERDSIEERLDENNIDLSDFDNQQFIPEEQETTFIEAMQKFRWE
jgi:1D-myo-inositol 3-kinase